MPKEGNRPGTRRKNTSTERPQTLSTHTNQQVAAAPLAAAPPHLPALPFAAAPSEPPPDYDDDAPRDSIYDDWYGNVNDDGSVLYINRKTGMSFPNLDELEAYLEREKSTETTLPETEFATLWREGGKRKSKKRKSKKRKSKKRKSKKRKSKKRKSKKRKSKK
jgi:hypothetical protein